VREQRKVVTVLFCDLVGSTALGEVLSIAGHVEDAAAALERAIVVHEQKGNVVSATRSRAMLDRLGAPS
jgi:class 3 adenylate cyclase